MIYIIIPLHRREFYDGHIILILLLFMYFLSAGGNNTESPFQKHIDKDSNEVVTWAVLFPDGSRRIDHYNRNKTGNQCTYVIEEQQNIP